MISKIRIAGYRKFKSVVIEPHSQFNLLIGDNEAGKSTLLEALVLALTGSINGRPASDELNPYWFNKDVAAEFFRKRAQGHAVSPPTITIEVFLVDDDTFQRRFVGAVNSELPTRACAGVTFSVIPNAEYAEELEEYFNSDSELVPVEYYKIDWRTFGDTPLTYKPRELAISVIDSRTIRSTSGVDFYLKDTLKRFLEPGEEAKVSLAYRQMKIEMTSEHLAAVNEKVSHLSGSLDGGRLSLAMDQSHRGSWDESVVPHVAKIPFSMSGQGQQASIKIVLALGKLANTARVVTIEEPENHLSHTSLNKLLVHLKDSVGDQQQLFVATHSSFVLNRLGLDSILFVSDGNTASFMDIDTETVDYFRKLPGYDTLRMVLADRFVLVEGPSDEILFERFYKDAKGKRPIEDGIDVISMRGLALKRCLNLAKVLKKKCAALRDNDGLDPVTIIGDLGDLVESGKRDVFVGTVEGGVTLEPQILAANPDEGIMQRALLRTDRAELAVWMKNNKTEAALLLAETTESIVAPPYFARAIEFIGSGEE